MTQASQTPTRRSKNFKRSNQENRQKARYLLRLWFEDRQDNQTNRYASVNGKPTTPAVDFNKPLKVDRADPVPQTRKRPVPDEKGHLQYDADGKLITETVSIMDTLTADGRETCPADRGLHQPSSDYTGYMGRARTFSPERADLVMRAKHIMAHVYTLAPEYHQALEMSVAGYADQYIADELGCGHNMARSLVDEGMAVVCTLVAIREWGKGDEVAEVPA